MNPLLRTLGIALFFCLMAPHHATAQKTYAVAVGGGAAIPVGKLNRTQSSGFNGLIALAIGAAEPPIGLRFDGIYNTFVKRGVVVAGSSAADLRVMGALGNLILAFSGTTAKPYVILGGGLYNTKPDVAGAESENYFGFNAGIGSTFGVGPLAVFLESRYHSIARKAAKGGVIQFVPITVGLMF